MIKQPSTKHYHASVYRESKHIPHSLCCSRVKKKTRVKLDLRSGQGGSLFF